MPLLAPTAPMPPIARLLGPNVVGLCNDLELRAGTSSGGGVLPADVHSANLLMPLLHHALSALRDGEIASSQISTGNAP